MTGKEFAAKCIAADRVITALRLQAEKAEDNPIAADPSAALKIISVLSDLISAFVE